jgi:quercetin dioxygenase-like cupin family protein
MIYSRKARRASACGIDRAPGRAKGAYVAFEPGARTSWHSHEPGRTIVVVHGQGRVGRWNGPVETVTLGDVVFFEPGEKPWHGVAPDCAMTHLAVGEVLNGKSADRAEPVTDAQYRG